MLTAVKGAQYYDFLKVYNGRQYDTFKEVCAVIGLVGDDNKWFLLFDEAIGWATSYQLRHIFMTVLIFCGIIDGKKLLEKYWTYMSDDISLCIQNSLDEPWFIMPSDYLYVQLIQDLTLLFGNYGYSFASFNLTIVPHLAVC